MKLKVAFTTSSFQPYTNVILDKVEIRREYPAVHWFIAGGELLPPCTSSSGPEDPAVVGWIPEKPGHYTLLAVALRPVFGESTRSILIRKRDLRQSRAGGVGALN